MKTRTINSSLYNNYLKKADEYLDAAIDSFNRQNWNSTVVNAIHCGISSVDALTVFFKGIRNAGERHEDSLALLQQLDFDKDTLNKKVRQLQGLLQVKNKAEYEEKLMSQSEAESAKKDAERLIQWAKDRLKK